MNNNLNNQGNDFFNQSNLSQDNNILNNGYNQQTRLKPNFSKKELDSVVLPNEIAKEIRQEKYRVTLMMFFGFIITAISLFFVLMNYLATPDEQGRKLKIPHEWQPSPILMFILMGVGVLIFIIGLVDYTHVVIAAKKYRGDILSQIDSIPFFLIRNYRAFITRPIYINWISFSIYIFGGIIIGIFYAIKAISKGDKPMNTEILTMIIILCSTLVVQIVSLIWTRARKGNIDAYYSREIITLDEIKDLRKKANRRCLIVLLVFIGLLLLFVVIPWLITRKKTGKKIIPFL